MYSQQEIWTTRPDPADTGFDLLADVLTDVAARNADSEWYDRPLLESIAGFKAVMSHTFTELALDGIRSAPAREVVLTPAVADAARNLYTNTPAPQRVRVVGRLDMLRASTQSFGVILDDGQEVRGVLTGADIESISPLMTQRVSVLGQAVYRPSGKLLRVDADEVAAAAGQESFFSAIPKPMGKTFSLRDVVRGQHHKPGLSAIIGKWPGDETDEQVAEALKESN